MSRDWRELLRLRRLITRRLLFSRLSLGLERLTAALWAPIILLGSFAGDRTLRRPSLVPGAHSRDHLAPLCPKLRVVITQWIYIVFLAIPIAGTAPTGNNARNWPPASNGMGGQSWLQSWTRTEHTLASAQASHEGRHRTASHP